MRRSPISPSRCPSICGSSYRALLHPPTSVSGRPGSARSSRGGGAGARGQRGARLFLCVILEAIQRVPNDANSLVYKVRNGQLRAIPAPEGRRGPTRGKPCCHRLQSAVTGPPRDRVQASVPDPFQTLSSNGGGRRGNGHGVPFYDAPRYPMRGLHGSRGLLRVVTLAEGRERRLIALARRCPFGRRWCQW